MCDSPQSLKLCTCSEQIDLSKESHWILNGGRSNREPPMRVVGSIAHPPDFETRSPRSISRWYTQAQESFERLSWGHLGILAEELEKLLNRSNCFDFEVELKRGTLLTLKFISPSGFECIQFEFKIKRWKAVGAWTETQVESMETGTRDPQPEYGPIR